MTEIESLIKQAEKVKKRNAKEIQDKAKARQ